MSDESATLEIPPVRTLTGHISADTAYLVEDYPYGYRLRCAIRYWVDTRTPKRGAVSQRFTSQTTNPKLSTTTWNKPKSSTYSAFVVMYLDDRGHVQAHHIPMWITGECDTRARHMGVYDALSDTDRKRYDYMVRVSRKMNPTTWDEWNETVARLADLITQTGSGPALEGNVWSAPDGQRFYLTDPAAYVTAARELITQR
jgi:hypothetical protein